MGSWHRVWLAQAFAVVAAVGCSGDDGAQLSTATTAGSGGAAHTGGAGGTIFTTTGSGGGANGGGGGCGHVLHALVRDRSPDAPNSNPDFENPTMGDDPNIVKAVLGADNTPEYNGQPTATTNGAQYFAEWYHDLASAPNHDFPIELPLTEGAAGVYTYDNQAFFPIDGQGFGDYASSGHNFHFTTEVHTLFRYDGGEVFTFTGDDDLFAFIDKQLVIDLGGIHAAESQSVNLDDLGLTPGNMYPLDIFGAERHTTESHFRVDTTIGCLVPPPPS